MAWVAPATRAPWHDPHVRKILILAGLVVTLTACGLAGDHRKDKRYQQVSRAMEPTVAAGSGFVAEVVKRGDYRPRAGDIVVFTPPAGWNAGDEPRILRVVAVPGDTISCCDAQDRVALNGTALDEPYAAKTKYDPPAAFESVTMPEGSVFLLGDNRGVANDSSYNGPVPVENVIGVVKL
ncbi:signal peptidase I [Micromonospora sp. H33]|uniref:signal peptidase I n=1 Tax=Micromonospora sp. H33 TaxID=3452215 RepID=UPI003F888093